MQEELEQREQADGGNAAAQLTSPKGEASPSSPKKRGRALWRLASSPRKPGLQKVSPRNRKGSSQKSNPSQKGMPPLSNQKSNTTPEKIRVEVPEEGAPPQPGDSGGAAGAKAHGRIPKDMFS